MSLEKDALHLHEKLRGKLEIRSKVKIDHNSLKLAYTPGVAEPCREINRNPDLVCKYTNVCNTVAVISDGSAVLGLGNIGPQAALPVMEGKCILFKEFADIDAYPIILSTQDPEKIIDAIKVISPSFSGINLEDISAPRCFQIEEALQDIGIPVFHDDQHGTAIVVLAALINASKVLKKDMSVMKGCVSGAGPAGTAIAKMLTCFGLNKKICSPVNDLIVVDSKGIISKDREEMDEHKKELSKITNKENRKGGLAEAIEGADVFVGLSRGGIVSEQMIRSMNNDAIVFAMANPTPEIMPDIAKKAGARIIGTGRSDFPNQINNVLGYPGIFRGALDARATKINVEMKLAAAYALAECVQKPTFDKIIPNPFDKNVVKEISQAVKKEALKTGISQISV